MRLGLRLGLGLEDSLHRVVRLVDRLQSLRVIHVRDSGERLQERPVHTVIDRRKLYKTIPRLGSARCRFLLHLTFEAGVHTGCCCHCAPTDALQELLALALDPVSIISVAVDIDLRHGCVFCRARSEGWWVSRGGGVGGRGRSHAIGIAAVGLEANLNYGGPL